VRNSIWTLLLGALLSACAPLPQQEFVVDTLNTQEGQIPCVVLVDDELQVGTDGQELRTPARLAMRFKPRPDGLGYQGVKLGVRAVKLDGEGKVISGSKKGESSEYQDDFRLIYPSDPPRQLFVLWRKRVGG
jgi:hypothetical protein